MGVEIDKLHQFAERAVRENGDRIFIKSTSGTFTYREFNESALYFEQIFLNEGIRAGDRIVIYSSKNVSSIAVMHACGKCNAVYVPVTAINPAQRAKQIIEDTAARFIICDDATKTELGKTELPLKFLASGHGVYVYTCALAVSISNEPSDAAFILFTSGSTGSPKGVVVSHRAALVFINWAADEMEISSTDVLASIAPFNFDLSVFDIYVTAKLSATLLLYTEAETKNALLMSQRLSLDECSVIYATPTFYSSLAYYGKLQKYEYSALKNILFAGEVFHLEFFYKLLTHWPGKNYINLYGPTETNVCTFFKVDTGKIDYPYIPIGKACDYARLIIVDENDHEIKEINIKGELLVSGASLFNGYWNDRAKTVNSFFMGADQTVYYRTGDIVFQNENGNYVYVSRKDRMIKRYGYRIEPSEIETAVLAYPGISNTAVLFSEKSAQLICYIEGPELLNLQTSELRAFCQNYLPPYMLPDKFVILNALPTTSSGKVDLQALISD